MIEYIYRGFMKLRPLRKVIVDAPIQDTTGTVLDVRIDSEGNIEDHSDNTAEKVHDGGPCSEPAEVKHDAQKAMSLSDVFGRELNETFKLVEAGKGKYACVCYGANGDKQQYMIFIGADNAGEAPVKVIPLIPSGQELFCYSPENPLKRPANYDVAEDKDNPGEIYLLTRKMSKIIKKYKPEETWSEDDVKEYINEIAIWTKRTANIRKDAILRRKASKNRRDLRFMYAEGPCKKCRQIVISDRAYTSIIAEALSRDPLETGGILLGNYDKDIWYIVEATDPGLSTMHNTVHHEMDDKYHNHIYPVLSRLYKNDLSLIGLWHRHPGSLNTFSWDDNRTNKNYAEAIGNGTLSFLLNFVPGPKLTCYYYDHEGSGSYHMPEVKIGDKYFKGTDYLTLADEKTLTARKAQLQSEIKTTG